MLSYVTNIYITGITSELAMSMIEDNLANQWRGLSSSMDKTFKSWTKIKLALEKSKIEYRRSNLSHPGENVACA